jgi:hypothetical protein
MATDRLWQADLHVIVIPNLMRAPRSFLQSRRKRVAQHKYFEHLILTLKRLIVPQKQRV